LTYGSRRLSDHALEGPSLAVRARVGLGLAHPVAFGAGSRTSDVLVRNPRQLFGMIRKVFFARWGWTYAVAALNARVSKMMLYALLPASIVPHLSTKIEP
jgi:hypothetical protein